LSFSFYSALLLRTLLLPVIGLVFVAMRALKVSQKAVDAVGGALFVILFLIYPSTSAAIFATFQCEELDDDTSWLRADLSIDCQSGTHTYFWGYAVLMVIVYPIGTPILYYVLLRRHKPRIDKLRVNQTLRIQLLEEVRAKRDYASSHVSTDMRQVPWLISKAERAKLPMDIRRQLRQLEREELKERKLLPGSVTKLLKGYELRVWWFEIFECFRKLAVACLPVFFRPSGSSEQLMYGLLTCFICFGVFVHFDPFEDRGNDGVARLCQAQIFFSLLSSVALVLLDSGASTEASLDILLVLLWCLPVSLAVFLESPLLGAAFKLAERWRSQQVEAGTWDRLNIKAVAVARTSTTKKASTVWLSKGGEAPACTASASVNTSQIDLENADKEYAHEVAATQGSAAEPSSSALSQSLLATFAAGPLGLGLSNRSDGTVVVTSVGDGSAAEAQGVRVNSAVLEVSGESTSGLDKEGILAMIRSAARPLTLKLAPSTAEIRRQPATGKSSVGDHAPASVEGESSIRMEEEIKLDI